MPSQLDLDQGGTSRQWVRRYMGPTIGWLEVPGINALSVGTNAGTVLIDPSTNFVQVNSNTAIILMLPSVRPLATRAGSVPGRFVFPPITIEDAGGKAQAHPITIMPFDVTEFVLGLPSITISVNYGGYVLQPNAAFLNWVAVSP